jgi:hypothetical protein
MKKTTEDGIPLKNLLKLIEEIEEVSVRTGSKHPHILNSNKMPPCPVSGSTNAKKMVVPWLREATGDNYNNNDIYQAIKTGNWYF